MSIGKTPRELAKNLRLIASEPHLQSAWHLVQEELRASADALELAEKEREADAVAHGHLLFSKRKAIVERCAGIVEEYARKAASNRSYMLQGPGFWIADIARAVREHGLSHASDTGGK